MSARHRNAPLWGLLVVVFATITSGCGHSADDASDPGWTPGPLDLLLQDIEAADGDDQVAATDRRLEEYVAECMTAQGFEYSPAPSTSMAQSHESDATDDHTRLSQDYIESHGYGIAVGDWTVESSSSETAADPQSTYRDELSDVALQEYEAALYGSTEADLGTEYAWESAGCYGEAQHTVAVESETTDLSGGLRDEVERFRQEVGSHPRVAALNGEWSACMSDAGYLGVSDPGSAPAELWFEYEQIVADDSADSTQLQAFARREVTQAVADFSCRGDIEYEQRALLIEHDLQQEFVDTHRAELDAWVLADAEARSN